MDEEIEEARKFADNMASTYDEQGLSFDKFDIELAYLIGYHDALKKINFLLLNNYETKKSII